jgi:hypothetical protein
MTDSWHLAVNRIRGTAARVVGTAARVVVGTAARPALVRSAPISYLR